MKDLHFGLSFTAFIFQDVHPADLLKNREMLSKIDHQLTMPEKEKLGKDHFFSFLSFGR